MKVPYGFEAHHAVGTVTVAKPFLVRQSFETAAWFRDHLVTPGEYTVYAKPSDNSQLDYSVKLDYAVKLDTVINDACLVSLYGGVAYGEDSASKREIGKADTYVMYSSRLPGFKPFDVWEDVMVYVPSECVSVSNT